MKLVRYGVAIGLLAGLGACSNMMGGSKSAPAPMAMAQPTVSPGMVKQVQTKLRTDGYYKQGNIDGVWGPDTQTAVRSFQHDHNLTTNGELDVPTLQAMNLSNGADTNTASTNPPPSYNGPTNNNAAGMTQPMQTNPTPANNGAPAGQH